MNSARLMGVLLAVCAVLSGSGLGGQEGQEAGTWFVYTKTGVDSLQRSDPGQVDLGPGTAVRVDTAVTGTGQGHTLEWPDAWESVSDGPGGQRAPSIVHERVYAIAEDKAKGHIWFATAGGLSRFDGSKWTTFTEKDGLAGNWCLDVKVDQLGRLWSVGADGISSFDGDRWRSYRFAGGGRSIAVSPNGDLWFAAEVLYRYRFDGNEWWQYGQEDGLPWPNGVSLVSVDAENKVWVALRVPEAPFPEYELTSFDGGQWVSYDVPPSGAHAMYIEAIFADNEKRIWIGTPLGLLRFDGRKWLSYSRGPDRSFRVIAAYQAEGGRIWLSEGNSFGWLEPGTTRYSYTSFAELQMTPQAMLVDLHGHLWAGTPTRGKLVRWSGADRRTGIEGVVSVPGSRSGALSQNHPNPFNPQTQIAFQIPQGGRLTLTVFSLAGQSVADLLDGEYPAGSYQASWDGRDALGREVASGVYLCRLAFGDDHFVRKMILLK